MLAEEVAQALGVPLLQWHIKSPPPRHSKACTNTTP
jgi:hypothetical protein